MQLEIFICGLVIGMWAPVDIFLFLTTVYCFASVFSVVHHVILTLILRGFFFVVWHCTTLQCAKAEDIPDIKLGSIGKDQSCFVFQIVSVFLCFCFQIVFHSDPECHIRQCFFDVLYMYTTIVKDVWLRILWYCLLYFISTFWLLFVAFCFMMSWTTRRIRTFTLDEAQLRSAKRTFGNRISQLFGAFGWSSQEHWACEFCKMRTFCLWVLHPGSLTYAKNALQTIASGVIIWTKRSRTRYLDLFCLFINSSIFTPRIMALHPSPCWTCQLEGLKSWQVLTSEVMRIPGERRGVLCQDVVEMLEPPCRWEAVGPIGQLFASFSAVGNLLRYFYGALATNSWMISQWLYAHALVDTVSHSECNVGLKHNRHIHLDHWLTVKSIESVFLLRSIGRSNHITWSAQDVWTASSLLSAEIRAKTRLSFGSR